MRRFGWALIAACVLSGGCAGARPVDPAPVQRTTPAPSSQTSAPAPAAPPSAPGAGCQTLRFNAGGRSNIGALTCLTGGDVPGFQKNDNLSNYYGYVRATTAIAAIEPAAKRSIGEFFRRLFNEETFTAEVSMVLELQTTQGVTPLAERPLLIIQRKADGDVEVNGDFAALNQTQVSPFFALDGANSGVQVRFRVRRVNDTQVNITNIVQAATDLAAGQGAEGWLVTGISQPAVLSALTRSQAFVSQYFSDQVTLSTTSRLSYGPGGQTGVSFETAWGGAVPASIKVSVQLAATQSLITSNTRTIQGSAFQRPDVTSEVAPTAGTWAQRIVVVPGANGTAAKTLDAVLQQNGVPRQLSGLSAGASETQAQQVQAACTDLDRALGNNEYFRLNQTDADLILYDQLRRAGVFARYDASSLECIGLKQAAWGRFGIVTRQTGDISYAIMERRLNDLSRAWKSDTEGQRGTLTSLFLPPVSIRVPATLIPGAARYLSVGGDGLTLGDSNPANLAEAQLTCLGAYRKDGPAVAYAFARFAGHDQAYQVQIAFVREEAEGVLIQEIVATPMTDTQRSAAAGSRCVAS